MKLKDFHLTLIELIDVAQYFPKTFWTMLVSPNIGFAKGLISENTTKILPGVFLFINLIIADLLASFGAKNIQEWLLQALKEAPSHIIGTLLFLFLLKLSFRKIKTAELFIIISLSSIVYIPYTIVMLVIILIVAPPLSKFSIFALSHHYQTPAELFAPLIPICYKLVPLLSMLMIVFVWWLWLLSTGCGRIANLSVAKRVLRLILSISAYILIFIVILILVAGSVTFSVIRGIGDYEKMMTSFKNENYAEAFILASAVSNNDKLPPVARYRAYMISAISQVKTFLKNDDTFRDAIVAINAKKYRDAEVMIHKEVKSRLLLLDSPMRFLFKNAEAALDEAAKQFNSPAYSETETTQIGFVVFFRDIPINLFPTLTSTP